MSKKFPLSLVSRDGFTVLELGSMEIWDGADMALLRESLTRLIKAEKHRAIGVDMTCVKYIPSGFFGMLFDWFETGVQIRLYTPQPNVRKMLWFNQFFEAIGHDSYESSTPATGHVRLWDRLFGQRHFQTSRVARASETKKTAVRASHSDRSAGRDGLAARRDKQGDIEAKRKSGSAAMGE